MARDEDSFREWRRRWGRLPFPWLFEDMDRMVEEMFREMAESIPKELTRERKLPDGSVVREYGPFVYGYSMTIGPDRKPVIREFGNVRPSSRPTPFGRPRPALEPRSEREPLTDIIEEKDAIRVVAELPGVEKQDIKLHAAEKALTISVETPTRKYYKEVDLPSKVDAKSAKATYKNGVLEVTLKKEEEKREPKGERIGID